MANGHGGARRGAGAKKGVQRDATKKAHEAIALAFDAIGGVEALTQWARDNPDSFYERVWPKIIPIQLEHSGEVTHEIRQIERTIRRPEHRDGGGIRTSAAPLPI